MLFGRSRLELDLLDPSVIQQLKQDIALCPSVHVDKESWTDSEFERTVKNQLRKSHQHLNMGLHRTTWDQWAKLEKLKPDWAQLERDYEVVTVIAPSFKARDAVRVSNQNNDSTLDVGFTGCATWFLVTKVYS
jgi:hypothetical protein